MNIYFQRADPGSDESLISASDQGYVLTLAGIRPVIMGVYSARSICLSCFIRDSSSAGCLENTLAPAVG